ncbi:hypothetical protein L9F63_024991, partial [Diploptera punctata]
MESALKIEFVKYFKPFYYTMKLFGLAPYCFRNKTLNSTYRSNVVSFIWSFILFTVVIYISLNDLNDLKKYSILPEINIVTNISAHLLSLTSLTALLLINFVHRNKFKNLFENLWYVDRILFSEIDLQNTYKRMYKLILFQVILFGIFVSLVFIDGFGWAGCRIITILSHVTYIFYCNVVCIIWHRLSIIKCKVDTIANETETNTGINVTRLYNSMELTTDAKATVNDSSNKILMLRCAYNSIKDIDNNLNSILGTYILLEMTYNFVSFVAHAYIGILSFKFVVSGGINILVVSLFAWILFYLAKQGIVCFLCNAASNQTQHLQGKLQNILLQQDNSKTHYQAQLFSTQISRNKITFSAAGFYVLNLNIFFTYVSSAISFLIILLQFR